MKYQWEEWSLDVQARVLKRDGRPFSVSRRVLNCIGYLIAQRERVVEHDELIRKVWGHHNVSNNQLSQVVLSARRVLGDDGHTQRLILTVPGVGYRWVGAVEEVPHSETASDGTLESESRADAKVATVAPHSQPVSSVGEADQDRVQAGQPPSISAANVGAIDGKATRATRGRYIDRGILAFGACLLLGLLAFLIQVKAPAPSPARTSASSSQTRPDSLQALEDSLREGEFDKVLTSLSALPPSKADSPDAMLIAMRLDLYRGRFDRARQKLDQQLALARAAGDPIWEAKLMVFDGFFKSRTPSTVTSRMQSAQAAIDLLEPLGEEAAPQTLAEALRNRAHALDDLGKYEDALHDLNRSARLYERAGDARGVLTIRSDRASFWLGAGRVEEAHQALRTLIDDHLQMKNNTTAAALFVPMARAQMELLRTEEAMESSDRAFALIQEMPDFNQRQRTLMIRAQVLTRLGRLSEARRLLEDTDPVGGDKIGATIRVLYLLEAGDDAGALKAGADAFVDSNWEDLGSIMLATREGALLTWTIAASRLVDAGEPAPVPSPMQADALRNPRTIPGIIASARWAMIRKEHERAEALLREALDKARQKGLRFHMLLATEPLFDLLLAQGRKTEARHLLDDVRAFDPERFDAEFHFVRMRWRLSITTGDRISAKAFYERLTALAGERSVRDSNPGSTASH